MLSRKSAVFGLVSVLALAAGVTALNQKEQGAELPGPLSLPVDSGVSSILCAAPFELAQPYTHDWTAERPLVASGWLVVLAVDPEQVAPRSMAEPVLQIGDRTPERVNHGNASGHVIAIVPGSAPLEGQPVFFAAPELPERVDTLRRSQELALAVDRGIEPFPESAFAAAADCGGAKLELAGRTELLDVAAQWILEYSPEEEALAFDLLRIPTND